MASAMISMLAAVLLLSRAPANAYEGQRETDSRESKIDRIFEGLADGRRRVRLSWSAKMDERFSVDTE